MVEERRRASCERCGKPVFCVHLVEFDKEDFSVLLLSCEDVYMCEMDGRGNYISYCRYVLRHIGELGCTYGSFGMD
jgi:hypothetical protein